MFVKAIGIAPALRKLRITVASSVATISLRAINPVTRPMPLIETLSLQVNGTYRESDEINIWHIFHYCIMIVKNNLYLYSRQEEVD